MEFAQAVDDGNAERFRGLLEELREAEPPLVPFHWQVELPEVFDRDRPGFDAIVGNPPFGGKNTIANANPEHYPDWLKEVHEESHGNANWVAHFYRRCFNLLRKDGVFGLIATNTIGQGDTRSTGLRWICVHGGEIFSARKRMKWPGRAAVTISVVHVFKGSWRGGRLLDDKPAETITAYLFHAGGSDDPVALSSNARKSFQGSIVLGMGFTFDDTDTKGIATSLAEMRRLVDDRPTCAEVIFPFIGYSEVAENPTHAHHRYIINFGERSEDECRSRWPDLMAIVESKVKPQRLTDNRASYRRYWWQYAEKRSDLQDATANLKRVLVAGSQASAHHAFAFLPTGLVYSSNLTVLAIESWSGFAILQCRIHEIWARFFMSTLEDRLAYTPTTCFEPFPFPESRECASDLKGAGEAYYEYRAALMVRNNEGLTKTYNRFHDPYEHDPGIQQLRELHTAMDRAVLRAYGWNDIRTQCEFLLDYEIDEEEWGSKRKPYRYRWPDNVHDEVLSRLIALNGERAAAEQQSGTAAAKRGRGARRPVAVPEQTEVLW